MIQFYGALVAVLFAIAAYYGVVSERLIEKLHARERLIASLRQANAEKDVERAFLLRDLRSARDTIYHIERAVAEMADDEPDDLPAIVQRVH